MRVVDQSAVPEGRGAPGGIRPGRSRLVTASHRVLPSRSSPLLVSTLSATLFSALFSLLIGTTTPGRAGAASDRPTTLDSPIPPATDVLRDLAASRLAAHIQFLGHDSLRGRAPGTPGGQAAAEYIAARLREYGIDPAGPHGSWFQPVPIHAGRPSPGTRLRIQGPRRSVTLALGDDYLLYTTGAATLIPSPVPMVFAGYGISAPEYDYDDYHDIDVRGAVAVFLSGEPPSADSAYFDGDHLTAHALPETKQRQALAHGARGSLLIPSPRETAGPQWSGLQAEFSFPHRALPYGAAKNLAAVLHPRAAEFLFHHARRSFREIMHADSCGRMESFPLHPRLCFHGSFQEEDLTAPNVVGQLRGSDPLLREQWIVLSAHYDGLGTGRPVRGDSIYNGVIDNASGVAALLEVARAMEAHPRRAPRSVLFLFTTGEESGLLGARYYCDHPLAPLHRTAAHLNFDGLAFLDMFDDVTGVGAGESTLEEILQRVAAGLGLAVSPIPALFSGHDEILRGDHYAFASAGIPSLLVQEGTAYRNIGSDEGLRRLVAWGRETYHTPFDDLAQPIRVEAAFQHLQLLAALSDTLARTLIVPQWKPGSPFAAARLRTLAEER